MTMGPRLRRAAFQIHLWTGLAAGLYVLVISISGAALVFRIDLQRALHPDLFTPRASGPLADPVAIMESVSRAYPGQRLSGVDAPTTSRPTYLAYVSTPQQFTTVLIDPVSAEVLGELPERSFVRTLQDLHYDLLGGRRGRTVNGVGAAALVVMGVTGIWVWWPGRGAWRRAITIDLGRRGNRLLWETHRAVGFWTVVLLLLWAITGMYFAFPAQARAIVGAVSPVTPSRTPQSQLRVADGVEPSWRSMIDRVRKLKPDGHVARVVLPFGERGAFLVMFASESPTPAYAPLESVYLDRFTGEPLDAAQGRTTIGDRIVRSMAPIHVGSFGGPIVRGVWFVGGLAPAVLFLTGIFMWWDRTVRGGRRR